MTSPVPPTETPFWPAEAVSLADRTHGWSRVAATAVLLLAVAVRIADPAFVETARLKGLDLLMTLAPMPEAPVSTVVVEIDDTSLDRFGQWPWPRDLVADLIDHLADAGVRAVVFDVLFIEPDRLSPSQLARDLAGIPPDLRNRLLALGDGDSQLAEAMANVATVTASAVATQTTTSDPEMPPTRIATRGPDIRQWLPEFAGRIRVLPILERAAVGDGVANLFPEPDGQARRVPTVFRFGDQLHPSLALEAARVAGGYPGLLIEASEWGGVLGIRIGERLLPTDAIGRVWVHLTPSKRIPQLSAAAILDEDRPLDDLRDKVVVLGLSASGVGDQVRIQGGDVVSGPIFLANAIDTILMAEAPARPALLVPAEIAAAVVLGVLLVIVGPGIRLRTKPLVALSLAGAAAGIVATNASLGGPLIDAGFPSAVIVLVVAVFAIDDIRQESRQRRLNQEALARHGAYMRNVVDASFDAIITLDDHASIRSVNRGAERLFGAEAPALITKPIQTCLEGPWSSTLAAAPGQTLVESVREAAIIPIDVRPISGGSAVPVEVSLAETATSTDRVFVMVLRDVTGRREAEARATVAAERLRDAIDALADGFALFTPSGEVLLCNATFRSQFPDRPPDRTAESTALGPHEFALPDGTWIRADERVTSEGGRVGVYTDITDLKHREALLADASQRAEAASQAKSEFLASMSHELRTPLNAVLGFAEMIRDDLLGEQGRMRYREYAGDISRSASGLLEMIEQILEFSRLDQNPPSLDARDLDLVDLVHEVVRDVNAAMRDRQSRIELQTSGAKPILSADPRLIYQIVQNLLSNAVKFSDTGSNVAISIGASLDGGCTLTVTDSGVGIPAELLEWVTQPFWQHRSALVRGRGGVGLGLAIVKANVDAHSGSIAIESTTGEGTSVTVSFPADRVISM